MILPFPLPFFLKLEKKGGAEEGGKGTNEVGKKPFFRLQKRAIARQEKAAFLLPFLPFPFFFFFLSLFSTRPGGKRGGKAKEGNRISVRKSAFRIRFFSLAIPVDKKGSFFFFQRPFEKANYATEMLNYFPFSFLAKKGGGNKG